MAAIVSIGNRPSTDRAVTCRYCGSAFFDLPTGYGVCDTCDVRNIFSDLWKDDHGTRPHFNISVKAARTWMEGRSQS